MPICARGGPRLLPTIHRCLAIVAARVGNARELPEEEAYARYGVAAFRKMIRAGQYK